MKTRFHQITLSKNASHLEQREALFAKELADRQKENADSINAHKKARSVTESLQRSRQLMQLEIERVATAGEAFREGTTAQLQLKLHKCNDTRSLHILPRCVNIDQSS